MNSYTYKQTEVNTMFENYPDILTLKQVQNMLHIGRNSMLDLIYSGEIEAFKIKGKWRILKSDLVLYIRRL